jgi:trk system potassium uptake protein TrkH
MALRAQLSPAQLLVAGFLGLIAVGTVLLLLPIAAPASRELSVVQALFTATSAVCVTGLIVVDTPNDLSLFGQLVVLALIQLGGLGYMTLTTAVAVSLGRRITLQERLALQETLHVHSLDGLLQFTARVLKLTVIFEALGTVVLAARWWSEHGPVRAIYLGAFHAVSAFNNAGFSVFSTSLSDYRGDVVVNVVVATLFVCGGVGYLVLSELLTIRRPAPLSLHTRLVLTLTGVLAVPTIAAIFLLERANPATLGSLGSGEAALAAAFQALTPRTAGFNTIAVGSLHESTLFVVMVLMFIGAGPGGTAGGIKVTTFGITVLALWATVRSHADAVVFGRRLPADVVARAFVISLIAFLAVNLVAGVLLIVEGRELLPTLFETISAFGTVGLSMGSAASPVSLVGHFSPLGQVLITVLMFAGRLGPMTLAIAVARGRPEPALRYPEGKVLIG